MVLLIGTFNAMFDFYNTRLIIKDETAHGRNKLEMRLYQASSESFLERKAPNGRNSSSIPSSR